METKSFKPVTITSETIDRLRRENNFSDLLALYVAYADVAQWQETTKVRATNTFMTKRMGWGRDKLSDRRSTLVGMGLIEDIQGNKNGKFTKNYVKVHYVVGSSNSSSDRTPENADTAKTDTSAYNSNLSPINSVPKGTADKSASHQNKKEEPPKDNVKKNFYLVVKQYQLPILNHKHIDSWCDKLRAALGEKTATAYLVRLQERDLRDEAATEQYVPVINRPLDILDKSGKIIAYYTRTKDKFTTKADLVEDPIVKQAGDAFPARWPKGKPEWSEDDDENRYFRGVKIDHTNQGEIMKIEEARRGA